LKFINCGANTAFPLRYNFAVVKVTHSSIMITQILHNCGEP